MAFFQECRLEFTTRILSFKTLVLRKILYLILLWHIHLRSVYLVVYILFLQEWCMENFINQRNMKTATEVRKQLHDICVRMDFPVKSCGNDSTTIRSGESNSTAALLSFTESLSFKLSIIQCILFQKMLGLWIFHECSWITKRWIWIHISKSLSS